MIYFFQKLYIRILIIRKIIYTLASILFVTLFFYYLGAINILKDNSNSFSKLQCVSYAPFSKTQSPFDKDFKLDEELVKNDLKLLSKYTSCIRTYSTVGLEKIPNIARDNNLKMLMGAWVGSDEVSTRKEIDTLIKLASENKDIVKAVIVGNEVLLRGDISSSKLVEYIKEVKKALPNTKVTYADVWEFWLKHPQIKELTDFVTIHILPYWEDDPMNIEKAIKHLVEVRIEVEEILGKKNILIGETGWPSEGRMREDVHPSKINQAKYIRGFVQVANERNWDYNIIEAFDQPWKRLNEGAVGGFWGIFDKDRNDKNVFKGEVSDFPNYIYLLLGSIFLIFSFSFLLKNTNISSKRVFLFTLVNTIFSILYIFQVEQYFITVRNNIEFVWAFSVLSLHLIIYYYALSKIVKRVDSIPLFYFYISLFFVVVTNIILAFDGRYHNFEIYAFLISSASFLYFFKDRIKELKFEAFEKVMFILILITSILVAYNETLLNIFSNIWILISFVFAYILFRGSKDISFSSIKSLVFYILVFFAISSLIKYGILNNSYFVKECEISSGIICSFRNFLGISIHYKVFGLSALITFLIAVFINKRKLFILSLFLSINAIVLYNIFLGSILFFLTLMLLTKRKI